MFPKLLGGTAIAPVEFNHMFESLNPTRECPRCRRDRAHYLRSMRKHSTLDWFKCDVCDHIFSDAGPNAPYATRALDKKPSTAA